MEARILMVEDDPDIAALLQDDLKRAGYAVSWATSVMTGLIQAREQPPELILLDLGLPDGDGRDLLRRLRKGSALPVIVLTARDVIGDKVELLTLGADDYVVKPFDPDELLARISVQLRDRPDDGVQVGHLGVYPQQRRVLFRGKEVLLTPTEFDILSVLIRDPGKIYSRAELNQEIWAGELTPESNVIDVHVGHLRGKLRAAQAYRLLRTVRAYGYALTTNEPD